MVRVNVTHRHGLPPMKTWWFGVATGSYSLGRPSWEIQLFNTDTGSPAVGGKTDGWFSVDLPIPELEDIIPTHPY